MGEDMADNLAQCLRCNTDMHPIQVVETDHAQHRTLTYAAIDAKPGFWFGRLPVAGSVAAMVCPSCGRIEFYAVPNPTGTNR